MKESKIIRRIILAILLICTEFLIYSIVTNPLGEHDIMFASGCYCGIYCIRAKQGKGKINFKV